MKADIAVGKGIYTENNFLLLEGCKARVRTTSSFTGKAESTRKQLLAQGIFVQVGEVYVLMENYLCNSPSLASSILAGRSSNGRTEWRDEQGRTLDENEKALID